MRRLCFFFPLSVLGFLCVFLFSSCDRRSVVPLRIGVDPYWTDMESYGQQKEINGFLEELLGVFAEESGGSFVRVDANWDSLFWGLRHGETDLVISSLPPTNFNRGEYLFSEKVLDLGAVLVVPLAGPTHIKDLAGRRIGVIEDARNNLFLAHIPEMIMHSYTTVPSLLDAVEHGEIDAALVDRLLALPFVNHLYTGRLRVLDSPLGDSGLRFVALKKEQPMVARMNRMIHKLSGNKTIRSLQEKWSLCD